MFHHYMGKMNEFLKKFKIDAQNEGEKFVVTFSGSKQDVTDLEEKYKALKTLGCCDEGCCDDDCCK